MLSIRAETTLSTYGSLEIARWKRRKNSIGLFHLISIHPLRMTQILDPRRTTLGSCCNPLGHILGESGSPWQCSLPSGCHGNSPWLLVTSTVEGTLVQEPWEVLPHGMNTGCQAALKSQACGSGLGWWLPENEFRG